VPLYRYRAVAPGGAVSTGELDAANEAEILDRARRAAAGSSRSA